MILSQQALPQYAINAESITKKMRFEDHCKKSKELFGDEGAIYHKWIDQYAEKYGYSHRNILHHQHGIEIAVMIFGEICRKHLEQHIKDDLWADKVPTIEDWKDGREL